MDQTVKPKHYIKNNQQSEQSQCSLCFELLIEKYHCTECNKGICNTCLRNSYECPHCKASCKFKLVKTHVEFVCPSNSKQCTAVLKSEREFQAHTLACLFVSPTLKTQFKDKRNYKCPVGHPLKFSLRVTNCQLCNTSIYSSRCDTCEKCYCIDCRVPLCDKQKCPNGHKYIKQEDGGFITCDLCGVSLRKLKDQTVYCDRQCNFDACKNCYQRLPQVLHQPMDIQSEMDIEN